MLKSVVYLLSFFFLAGSYGQVIEIPTLKCPCFQYIRYGRNFIGKLTLPNKYIKPGWTTVEVHFSQRFPLEREYFGNITLFEDEEKINSSKENVQEISYRIDFPNKNEMPKMTQVAINSADLCFEDTKDETRSNTFKLQHSLRITIQSIENMKTVELKGNDIPKPQEDEDDQSPFIPVIQTSLSSDDRYLNEVCGKEDIAPSKGPILRHGEFPWLVAIYEKKKGELKFISSGTLVSAHTVVTAAHYFMSNNLTAEDISVYLGRYNISKIWEDYVQRDVRTLLIHPEYRSDFGYPDADIALLRLLSPVGLSQYIKPICLWRAATEESLIGQSAVVAGWNNTDIFGTSMFIPKKIDANIVSNVECLWSSPAYYGLISSRTLCGGKRDGTGPCGGGNGLLINHDGSWKLRGIVSAGLAKDGECDLSQYVVYCDLEKHISWIKSYM